jgi:hypothetical protein
LLGAAVAFAGAVISKYGSVLLALPLLGLLVSVHGARSAGGALAVFLPVAGAILAAYFWLAFGSLAPASSAAYLGQAFGRSRGHIAALQAVFALAPLALASAGALIAWRRGRRLLAATCLIALSVYPAFHLWSGNFVSGQKHVVGGFLFAYLLAGVALERLWVKRSRVTALVVLAVLTTWGGLQCYWQDRSWSDPRALADHLALHVRHGEQIVAESPWSYILHLYPKGVIGSPADVIDAHYAPGREGLDLCRISWLVGNLESSDVVRAAVARCGHRPVLLSTTAQYYFDTTRLRVAVQPAVTGVYRLPCR